MRRLYLICAGIPAVFIDGTLYVSWSMLTALLGIFSGEEAYKYVNPHVLFWSKTFLSVLTAGAGALKMFRSTSYSDHQKTKSGDTQIFLPNPETKKD